MKESEAYQLAEMAVVNSPCLSAQDKLAVLRVLFDKEDLALYIERKEEKEKENG